MAAETKQFKLTSFDQIEFKETDASTMSFEGYASKFGGIDAYGDRIDPKAYDRTIKPKNRQRPIRLRWNHYGPIIGKWMEMLVDDKGLYVKGELTPGHRTAEDVYASLKHGAVDGMSIGYWPKKIEMVEEQGRKIRLLKEIELFEISVVEEPADLGAKVGDVKSLIETCSSIREVEAFLRDAGGFSRDGAIALVGRIKSLALRDAEAEVKAANELRALFERA
jgi:hypothetical protein